MAGHEIVKEAQGMMVVEVRSGIQVRLLPRVFPVPCCILKEHDREQHVNHDCFCSGRLKGRVIVHSRKLIAQRPMSVNERCIFRDTIDVEY